MGQMSGSFDLPYLLPEQACLLPTSVTVRGRAALTMAGAMPTQTRAKSMCLCVPRRTFPRSLPSPPPPPNTVKEASQTKWEHQFLGEKLLFTTKGKKEERSKREVGEERKRPRPSVSTLHEHRENEESTWWSTGIHTALMEEDLCRPDAPRITTVYLQRSTYQHLQSFLFLYKCPKQYLHPFFS